MIIGVKENKYHLTEVSEKDFWVMYDSIHTDIFKKDHKNCKHNCRERLRKQKEEFKEVAIKEIEKITQKKYFIRVVQTHTGKTHKAGKDDRPACAKRNKDIFSEYIELHPSDGHVFDIDCKKCIAKIKKQA